jgi:hypothetical protein
MYLAIYLLVVEPSANELYDHTLVIGPVGLIDSWIWLVFPWVSTGIVVPAPDHAIIALCFFPQLYSTY